VRAEVAAGRASAVAPAAAPRPPAVAVTGLRKSYGGVAAVRDVSFSVAAGEIFALLGPNGAGKTSILEILEGFRGRDSGRVDVLGLDPADRSQGRELRERIGLVLQDIAVEPYLTVRETVARNAGYYPAPRSPGEVISLVGLDGAERQRVRNLSGGQKRRLDLALGLVGNPELLFLDEPATGFDPSARRDAWEIVRGLRAAGITVVLTTHYMEEAQALADRVAVLSGGQIAAEGTPATIGGRNRDRTRIRFALPGGYAPADLPLAVRATAGPAETGPRRAGPAEPGATAAGPETGLVTVETAEPARTLHELTGWALARGVPLDRLTVDRPSLEDVYLRLTESGAGETTPERNPL
jgi:ABC-2 type transport system ATP-binding protein